jgi:hypothetical protein
LAYPDANRLLFAEGLKPGKDEKSLRHFQLAKSNILAFSLTTRLRLAKINYFRAIAYLRSFLK